MIGLSVDPLDSHLGWEKDIEETQGTALNFPIIADADRKVSDLYDMIHPNANDTFTVRSVYVIGPDKKVKLMLTYPACTGRNFDETASRHRLAAAYVNYSVATPVNWKDGEHCIIVPSITDEQAKEKFPAGWETVKPYLRITPQPNKVGQSESQSA